MCHTWARYRIDDRPRQPAVLVLLFYLAPLRAAGEHRLVADTGSDEPKALGGHSQGFFVFLKRSMTMTQNEQIEDRNLTAAEPLVSPNAVKARLPLTPAAARGGVCGPARTPATSCRAAIGAGWWPSSARARSTTWRPRASTRRGSNGS